MPNPETYQLLLDESKIHKATLLVVSKTRTEAEILSIYRLGQRIFGENRAQELIVKAALLPADIEWHLIGHLQTNKVKSIIQYVNCVQSLDSLKLWQKMDEEAKEACKAINCLLQIKIAEEETKYGWEINELEKVLKSGLHIAFSNIKICGVMGMASLTSNIEQVRAEMQQLKHVFDSFKQKYFSETDQFAILSMGMSGDYTIALEEGSNMIRVGSLVFE
ncbi:MAG: YggS family pyridoxal phosphate-dependent enzyme [Saprospiraceae bacterium]